MQRCLEGAWGLPFGEKGLQGFPPREERSLSASHTSEDGEQRSRPPLTVALAVAAGNLVMDTPRRHGLAGLPRPSSEAGPLRQELGLLKERPAEPTLSRRGKHYTLVPGPSAASEDLFCAGKAQVPGQGSARGQSPQDKQSDRVRPARTRTPRRPLRTPFSTRPQPWDCCAHLRVAGFGKSPRWLQSEFPRLLTFPGSPQRTAQRSHLGR